MVLKANPAFIGVGLAFPLDVPGTTGAPGKNTNIDRIEDSIIQIMGTALGSRFFRRNFGSELRELVFEPLDIFLEQRLIATTAGALSRFEKRIIVDTTRIIVDPFNPSKIEISIEYTIADSQLPGNLVIPFILTDSGTLQLDTTS